MCGFALIIFSVYLIALVCSSLLQQARLRAARRVKDAKRAMQLKDAQDALELKKKEDQKWRLRDEKVCQWLTLTHSRDS